MEPGINVAKIGEKAPGFAAKAFQNGEVREVSLDDYKGKWVILAFYPADFTFICPTELSRIADYYEELKSLNTEVISVSTDTEFVHKAWWDNSPSIKKIQFPMLADPTGRVCRSYGTYIDEEGLSLRGTFIISPEGVLKSADIHDNSIGRSVKEIVRKLKAAQYVEEHGGEVCPVDWESGQDTLKPGMDLVGKI